MFYPLYIDAIIRSQKVWIIALVSISTSRVAHFTRSSCPSTSWASVQLIIFEDGRGLKVANAESSILSNPNDKYQSNEHQQYIDGAANEVVSQVNFFVLEARHQLTPFTFDPETINFGIFTVVEATC